MTYMRGRRVALHPDWSGAEPEWTVTTDFFSDCLLFFRRHYNPVSVFQVLANYHEGITLPPKALLITFDDGWRYNLNHAAPLLKQHEIPALLFVTIGAVGKPILSWQEALFALWKTGQVDLEKRQILHALAGISMNQANGMEQEHNKLVASLRKLSPEQRNPADQHLMTWVENLPGLPYMLNWKELKELEEYGFSLGTHGVSHDSLIGINNAREELHTSSQELKNHTASANFTTCFAPPQGLYNRDLLDVASETGYSCICTGQECLNETNPRKGFICLGRININQSYLMKAHYVFQVDATITRPRWSQSLWVSCFARKRRK